MDCFIHISGNIHCYTGQCKKQKQYMGPIFKLKRWETANNYNTVLKSVAEIISIYVHMYNCIYNWRALIALRFIRDLLYNILFSLKALVFMLIFEHAWIFRSMPEFPTFYTSVTSMSDCFLDSLFHKQVSADFYYQA